MKGNRLFLALMMSLALVPSAFAIDPPIVQNAPDEIDADSIVLKISTEAGAKVTVIGGLAQLAPLTDGDGEDLEDGIILFEVGLAQETENTFSVVAEKNGAVSESAFVSINEVKTVTQSPSGGTSTLDNVPPAAPSLNPIPDIVDNAQYWVFGNAEPDSQIYARRPDGSVAGSALANDVGFFRVLVLLERGKTNRFNISAEDEAGNEGDAAQAVIRATEDASQSLPDELPEEEDVEERGLTSAQLFFDDTQGHWAEDYIDTLREEEVVSGKADRLFDPNGLITRAELTKIAILAFGHSINTSTDEHPFSDVPRNSWFAPYVDEARRLGIVEGYPSGGFGPNDFVTRAAALKIILGAAGVDAKGPSPDFWDVPTESWFMTYIAYAKANGVVGGYEDGSFRPGANITRAEVAKIVVEVLEKTGKQVKGECVTQYEGSGLVFDHPCDWEIRTGSDDGIETNLRVVAPDGRSVIRLRTSGDFDLESKLLTREPVMIGGREYKKRVYELDPNMRMVLYMTDNVVLHRFDLYHQNNVGLYEMERILDSLNF